MPKSLEVVDGEWECMECGFIEEGPSNRRPKKCPECGASASAFEFFEYEDEDWDDSEQFDEDDLDIDDEIEDDWDDEDEDFAPRWR